jgi:hypothetical protein
LQAVSQQQKQQQKKLTNPVSASHSDSSASAASATDLLVDSAANSHSSSSDVNEADHNPVNEVLSSQNQATSAGVDVPGQYYNVACDAGVYDSIGNYAEVNSVQYDDVTRNSAVYEVLTDNIYTNIGPVTNGKGDESRSLCVTRL